jgi:hypothetical protein
LSFRPSSPRDITKAIEEGTAMNRSAIKLALIAGALAAAAAVAATAQPKGPLAYATDGKLIAPADYREWVFLSAGLDMTYGPAAPPAGVHRFDNVFVDPAAYQGFKRTGAWPDKTVMVLEIRNAAQDVSINKAGHVQTDVAAIELHVKDEAKGGWGFYSVSAKGETRKIPENSACHACHTSSGAVDTTFVQFYPTLIEAAKKAGTLKQ